MTPPTAQPENNQTIRAALAHPVSFARGILRDDPWDMQREILTAVAKHPRVAVKACHNSSKTFLAAESLLWWITHFGDGIVVSTAPSDRQVEKLLWGEVHKAMARSVFPYPSANLTELRLGLGNYAIGFSTDKRDQGVRFQGFHSPNLLIIMDEAPGINADVWQAIEGIRAGGNVHVLALGNPTIAGGPFHDAFTANREGWRTFTIDAFDTPNFGRLKRLAGGSKDRPVASAPTVEAAMIELLRSLPADHNAITYSSRPYLISVQWARERLREWGIASPLWQSRVRGQFPTQAEDALISLAWLEAARAKAAGEAEGKIAVGIDVAEAGEDETVMVFRQGPRILRTLTWPGREAQHEALGALLPYKGLVEVVNYDSIGVGAYFAENIEAAGFNIQPINVQYSPRDKEKFSNLKAELYWGLRMRFESGDVAGLVDERAISQLATIRYSYNARGQLVIESKEDARKRGIKSPDRAEAIMLAFADREPAIIKYYEQETGRAQEAQNRGLSEPEPLVDDMTAIYEETLRELQAGKKTYN